MGIITSVLGSLVTFAVSMLIGGVGIYVGGLLVTGEDDFRQAVWTALFASLGWAVATFFVSLLIGWIPLLGGLVALALGLVGYVAVVDARYDGGWGEATVIALIGWLTAAAVRFLIPFV